MSAIVVSSRGLPGTPAFRNTLRYELLVGLRYTRAKRRNHFISFISLISMAGIGLGVAALIVVLSVMNGFQKEVTDRMLSVLAHVEVFDNSGSMPDWRAEAAQAFKNPAVNSTKPSEWCTRVWSRN